MTRIETGNHVTTSHRKLVGSWVPLPLLVQDVPVHGLHVASALTLQGFYRLRLKVQLPVEIHTVGVDEYLTAYLTPYAALVHQDKGTEYPR